MSIEKKKQILDAASKSFSVFGYKATTMDQIAKIAGVAKGTIYTLFTNKEELFNEILTQLIDEMSIVAQKSIRSDISFFENLHTVLYNMLDFRRSHELTIKLSFEIREMGTPAAKEAMKKMENVMLAFIKKQVERAVENGEMKECDPEITAFVILKLYVTFISDWEKRHEPLTNEEISKLFQLYLVEGLQN
ncbi:TetR family transcriptional regulator [Chengkuizengella sediminis]|uniref:TetR family transcriptional regulator n=1 Tax=Chengkuizengella sediminis TaxID=1885917 RepID=UPI0013897B91|nr:TetR/AcrR family transcriptional regulator [Chengkuizengella sediminis]